MKKNTRNTVILAILMVIIVLVYARIFFKRPSRQRRIAKASTPVVRVEKKKEAEEMKELELLPERGKPQEWGRSPFVLPGEIMVGLPEEEELVLTGITWKGGRALALIGDRMVRVGDIIGGKRVAKIKRDSVILGEGKREYILMLSKEGRP